jgi:hypothetical protein
VSGTIVDLATILERNSPKFPKALDPRIPYIVRFHSFWPWHDLGAYAELASQKDRDMLKYVLAHRQCDLYSKEVGRAPADAPPRSLARDRPPARPSR